MNSIVQKFIYGVVAVNAGVATSARRLAVRNSFFMFLSPVCATDPASRAAT